MIASDGKTTKITNIQSKFGGTNARFFVDKPKIIIKAACRGSQVALPIMQEKKVTRSRPTEKFFNPYGAFISIFGTTEGKMMLDRGYEKGSFFAEKLYEVLKDNFWRKQEIGAIATELGNRIKKSSNGLECVEVKTTKTKPIFFRKHTQDNEQEETKEDE